MLLEKGSAFATFRAIRFSEIEFESPSWCCEVLPNGCVQYRGAPFAAMTVRTGEGDAAAARTFMLLPPAHSVVVCGDVVHIPRPVLAIGAADGRSRLAVPMGEGGAMGGIKGLELGAGAC